MPGCIARLLSFVVVVGLLISSAGCGAVFIGGAITTGTSIQGTVSTVQLVDVNGNIQVTLATFLQNGFSSSMNFCGNQIGSFPLNRIVQVNFNSGQPCASLLLVVITG